MAETTDNKLEQEQAEQPKKKISWLAIASGIFCLSALALFVLSPFVLDPTKLSHMTFPLIPLICTSSLCTLVLGIAAIISIRRNKEVLAGKGVAYTSLIISLLLLVFFVGLFVQLS